MDLIDQLPAGEQLSPFSRRRRRGKRRQLESRARFAGQQIVAAEGGNKRARRSLAPSLGYRAPGHADVPTQAAVMTHFMHPSLTSRAGARQPPAEEGRLGTSAESSDAHAESVQEAEVSGPTGEDDARQIFVRLLGRGTLVVQALAGDTVLSVQQQIEVRAGVPLVHQRLICCGRQLPPEATLAQCGVDSLATLQLVARLPSKIEPVLGKSGRLIQPSMADVLRFVHDASARGASKNIEMQENVLRTVTDFMALDLPLLSSEVVSLMEALKLGGFVEALVGQLEPCPSLDGLENKAIQTFSSKWIKILLGCEGEPNMFIYTGPVVLDLCRRLNSQPLLAALPETCSQLPRVARDALRGLLRDLGCEAADLRKGFAADKVSLLDDLVYVLYVLGQKLVRDVESSAESLDKVLEGTDSVTAELRRADAETFAVVAQATCGAVQRVKGLSVGDGGEDVQSGGGCEEEEGEDEGTREGWRGGEEEDEEEDAEEGGVREGDESDAVLSEVLAANSINAGQALATGGGDESQGRSPFRHCLDARGVQVAPAPGGQVQGCGGAEEARASAGDGKEEGPCPPWGTAEHEGGAEGGPNRAWEGERVGGRQREGMGVQGGHAQELSGSIKDSGGGGSPRGRGDGEVGVSGWGLESYCCKGSVEQSMARLAFVLFDGLEGVVNGLQRATDLAVRFLLGKALSRGATPTSEDTEAEAVLRCFPVDLRRALPPLLDGLHSLACTAKIRSAKERFLARMCLHKGILNRLLWDGPMSSRPDNDLAWMMRHRRLLEPATRRAWALFCLPQPRESRFEVVMPSRDGAEVLQSSLDLLADQDAARLRQGVTVRFENELAAGPGVVREWMMVASREVFSPARGLFAPCPGDGRRFILSLPELQGPSSRASGPGAHLEEERSAERRGVAGVAAMSFEASEQASARGRSRSETEALSRSTDDAVINEAARLAERRSAAGSAERSLSLDPGAAPLCQDQGSALARRLDSGAALPRPLDASLEPNSDQDPGPDQGPGSDPDPGPGPNPGAYTDPGNALMEIHPQDRSHEAQLRLAGRLVGLALMHRVALGVSFCGAFFKQLAGRRIVWRDAEDADPELYRSCKAVLELEAEQMEDLGLTFATAIPGRREELPLVPGGEELPVTAANRRQFVDLLVEARLGRATQSQAEAFARGLGDLVVGVEGVADLLAPLDPEDIDALLRGQASEVSIADWQAHTVYHKCDQDEQFIIWFWQVVEEMDSERRRRLLSFATAVRYLPVTGFAGLSDCFQIHRSYEGHDTLPTAHTCFYQLVLPAYETLEVMRSRLFAITEEYMVEGFGFV